MKKSILTAVLLSCLIVGTLDILLAFANSYIKNNNVTPDKVLRFIASGVFDKKAFAPDNTIMILWGLLFHYLIALGFTVIFYFIYPRIKWLPDNEIVSGILYGITIWVIMHFLVLPASNAPAMKFELWSALRAIVILIAAIGIPLVFLAGRFYSSRQKNETI